jgi:hypothetical protein
MDGPILLTLINHSTQEIMSANAQRADEANDQQRAGRRPEHTAKVGNVEIAVWKNQGANGDSYTASSPVIRYKDGTSGEFEDGSNYGQLDLLALAEAAHEASDDALYIASAPPVAWSNRHDVPGHPACRSLMVYRLGISRRAWVLARHARQHLPPCSEPCSA